MNEIRVFVTATGCAGVGEQLLKTLRLSSLPLHITAADCAPYSSGFAGSDAACILPPARDERFSETLLRECRNRRIRALFIGSEAELSVIAPLRGEFEREGIFLPVQPPEVLRCCMDKAGLYERLAGLGFYVPWHCRVGRPADLAGHPDYPLIFKPSRQSGGSADVFIVRNALERDFFAEYLLALHGEFVAQAYVGTPEEEFTIGVLHDMDGARLGALALHRDLGSAFSRRLRVANTTARPALGPQLVISSGISQGVLGAFPELCAQGMAIAEALGSRGPMNIQCRRVDGRLCLFEINPRFSGTTPLRALGGWNEPEILMRRHILGELTEPQVPSGSLRIGRRLEEVIITEEQQGEQACRIQTDAMPNLSHI